MNPEIKLRPQRLQFDTYRGVLIASSVALAVQAETIPMPNHLPPVDITFFADVKALDALIYNLGGRPFFWLLNGKDEHDPWFHSLAERLIKIIPRAGVSLLMPNSELNEWYKPEPLPQPVYSESDLDSEDSESVAPNLEPDMSIIRQGRSEPPSFPLEVFGEFWQAWILSKAKSSGAPVDYVAGALLASTSALIGNARKVSPWDGWEEPAALWIANVGNPSSGKSPATDPILNIVRELENELSVGFKDVLRDYETAKENAAVKLDLWRAEVKQAAKKQATPPLMPENAMEPEQPTVPE